MSYAGVPNRCSAQSTIDCTSSGSSETPHGFRHYLKSTLGVIVVPRTSHALTAKWFAALVAVSALAGAIPPEANAQVAIGSPAIQCEFCTPTQMRQAAASRGDGEHYVADVPGGVLRRFAVSCGSGQLRGVGDGTGADVGLETATSKPDRVAGAPSGGETLAGCTAAGNVTALDVGQAALDQFNVVRQVWIETAGTFAKTIDYPYVNTGMFWSPPPGPLGGPNAYNVLSDTNFRGMLGTALANNSWGFFSTPSLSILGSYVAAMINAYTGQTDGLRVQIRLVFPDGSSVVYLYTYDAASAVYEPNSARTAVGQVIPDPEVANSPASTGYWAEIGPYGGQEDLQRFLDYMASRGVQITGGGDGGRIRGISCTWDGVNLSCVTT